MSETTKETENLRALCDRIGIQAWLETKSVLLLDAAEKETAEKRKAKLQEFGEMLRVSSEMVSAHVAQMEKMAVRLVAAEEMIKKLTLDDFELKTKTDEKAKESSIQPNNSFLDDTHGDAPF